MRVTTATPERVGTLITERAMAEAGMPNECGPLALGSGAVGSSCLRQRPVPEPVFRGAALQRSGPRLFASGRTSLDGGDRPAVYAIAYLGGATVCGPRQGEDLNGTR
jgi:hypothetical protein